MDIKVNISVENLLQDRFVDNKILILFNKVQYADTFSGVIEINSAIDLKEKFDHDDDVDAFNELYNAEYLLRTGASLMCYVVDTPDSIKDEDIEAIEDIEALGYRFIAAPGFALGLNGSVLNLNLSKLYTFVEANPVELFLNIKNIDAASTETLVGKLKEVTVSYKIQLFKNYGLPGFKSIFVLPETTPEIKLSEFGEGFLGIQAASAVLIRKVILLEKEYSWLPIAGESYGKINEFYELLESYNTKDRKAIQALNVNLVVSKRGVGNIFISQNTMFEPMQENKRHPFYRAHVVTSALTIKRDLENIASSYLFRPNNSKTWEDLRLRLEKYFSDMKNKDGIEEFEVNIGRNITFTDVDIANGLIKAYIKYLPIRVVEGIELNLVIQQNAELSSVEFFSIEDALDINIEEVVE